MQPFRPWFDQVWLRSKIAQNPLKVCMHGYLSILRSWSNVKLHRVILLGFGLKESKINLNIMKVALHSYLPNAHLNLWPNFNLKKLVKGETSSCGFAKIGVKCGENSSKCREGWSACLSINRASKSMIKFQFWEFGRN